MGFLKINCIEIIKLLIYYRNLMDTHTHTYTCWSIFYYLQPWRCI